MEKPKHFSTRLVGISLKGICFRNGGNYSQSARGRNVRVLVFSDSYGDSESMEKVMNKEPFDYTKWQQDLYSDVTVNEPSQKAMENIK